MLNRMDLTDDYIGLSINKIIKWYKKDDYHFGNIKFYRGDHISGSLNYRLNIYEPSITLDYTHTDRYTGQKTDMNYKIKLEITICNLGGHRYWFKCPIKTCNRQSGVLYAGKYFACRKCYKLHYRSQSESNENKKINILSIKKMFDYIEYDNELQKLKRLYYRNKPTKKHQKIINKMRAIGKNIGYYTDILHKKTNKK